MDEAALAAADQATQASAELIRYALDGAMNDTTIFAEDVLHKLAFALKLAICIQHSRETNIGDFGELNALAKLNTALTEFLRGWVI